MTTIGSKGFWRALLLLPCFLFALLISPNFGRTGILWTFLALHFVAYPPSQLLAWITRRPILPLSLGAVVATAVAAVLLFTRTSATAGILLLLWACVIILSDEYKGFTGIFMAGITDGLLPFFICYCSINGFPATALAKGGVVVPALVISLLGSWIVPRNGEDYSTSRELRGSSAFALFVVPYLYFTFGSGYALLGAAIFIPLAGVSWLLYAGIAAKTPRANHVLGRAFRIVYGTAASTCFAYLFLDNSHVIQAIQGGF